jgi:predicted DCC family thiol-disulfide oxidoreductase YuxK
MSRETYPRGAAATTPQGARLTCRHHEFRVFETSADLRIDSPISRTAMPHAIPALTVFFDGACPLCRREIAHYRQRDRAGRIAFVDIVADPAPLAAIGVSPEVALAAMHARRADGSVVRGAAAFVALWAELPRWRVLARIVTGVPGLLALAERVYAWVAPRRSRVAAAMCRDDRCA